MSLRHCLVLVGPHLDLRVCRMLESFFIGARADADLDSVRIHVRISDHANPADLPEFRELIENGLECLVVCCPSASAHSVKADYRYWRNYCPTALFFWLRDDSVHHPNFLFMMGEALCLPIDISAPKDPAVVRVRKEVLKLLAREPFCDDEERALHLDTAKLEWLRSLHPDHRGRVLEYARIQKNVLLERLIAEIEYPAKIRESGEYVRPTRKIDTA